MKNTDLVEQWYSMQKAFLPPPEILASSKEKCSQVLGEPGKDSGQHSGVCEWLVRATPYGSSFSVQSRRAYVWNRVNRRLDSGVSGLGPWNVRADHG